MTRQLEALKALMDGPVDSRVWARTVGISERSADLIFRRLERKGLATLAGSENFIWRRYGEVETA